MGAYNYQQVSGQQQQNANAYGAMLYYLQNNPLTVSNGQTNSQYGSSPAQAGYGGYGSNAAFNNSSNVTTNDNSTTNQNNTLNYDTSAIANAIKGMPGIPANIFDSLSNSYMQGSNALAQAMQGGFGTLAQTQQNAMDQQAAWQQQVQDHWQQKADAKAAWQQQQMGGGQPWNYNTTGVTSGGSGFGGPLGTGSNYNVGNPNQQGGQGGYGGQGGGKQGGAQQGSQQGGQQQPNWWSQAGGGSSSGPINPMQTSYNNGGTSPQQNATSAWQSQGTSK